MDRIVEKNDWKSFLNNLGKRNEQRLARLEILSDEFGANEEAKDLPLLGISFEEKGSETGDVLISLGGARSADAAYVTRTVKDVVGIRSSDDGDAVEIKGSTGETAILSFEQTIDIGSQGA